jgi:hypothetical protein
MMNSESPFFVPGTAFLLLLALATACGGSRGDPVDPGSAGNFAILAKGGVSTVPISAVTGDLGLSPAAAGFITGFALTSSPTDSFSTSPQVSGRVYAADYASPTPSTLTTAVGDIEAAFTDAAGRAADVTELGARNIGGMTLAPGVYKWGTGLLIPEGRGPGTSYGRFPGPWTAERRRTAKGSFCLGRRSLSGRVHRSTAGCWPRPRSTSTAAPSCSPDGSRPSARVQTPSLPKTARSRSLRD